MTIAKRLSLALVILCFSLSTSSIAFGQGQRSANKPPPASVPITVSATGTLVRFTALGAVERMRLEVFDAAGVPVFDTGFRAGNLRDWKLKDTHGQRLPDATYLCVVTVRELTGRMSFKQGSVMVQSGKAALALEGNTEPEGIAQASVTPDEGLSTRPTADAPAMTVTTHDGGVGHLTSTTGDLTFRTGDIFTGKDKEQMRITEDGKVGIGTKTPQAALDVAGAIRAGEGIHFSDGSVLTSAKKGTTSQAASAEAETIDPKVSGTGTTGRLVKWTNGATGALGDSVVTESAAGNIGIGTATPNSKLHVVGRLELGAASGGGVNPTLTNPNNLANFAQVNFYPASGTNTNMSFAVSPRGTGVANNRAQFGIYNTDYIANSSNYEFLSLRARGNDFVLSTGKGGSGTIRPLMLSAGFLSDNLTNNNQLVLATNGWVGVGTNSPVGKLTVVNNTGHPALSAANTSTGRAGVFQIDNANNQSVALVATTSGLGDAGEFTITNPNSDSQALRLSTNGFGTTLIASNNGLAGGAGRFEINDENNDSHAVRVSTDGNGTVLSASTSGTGIAGFFQILNTASNKNALHVETLGTGFAGYFAGFSTDSDGVYIQSGVGEKGLEVNKGRIILSYASVADGGTIPSDVAVVNVPNNGVVSNAPSVALPATAENGTVIIVGTSDPDGAEITGVSGGALAITNEKSRRFTRIGGAWKTEF